MWRWNVFAVVILAVFEFVIIIQFFIGRDPIVRNESAFCAGDRGKWTAFSILFTNDAKLSAVTQIARLSSCGTRQSCSHSTCSLQLSDSRVLIGRGYVPKLRDLRQAQVDVFFRSSENMLAVAGFARIQINASELRIQLRSVRWSEFLRIQLRASQNSLFSKSYKLVRLLPRTLFESPDRHVLQLPQIQARRQLRSKS